MAELTFRDDERLSRSATGPGALLNTSAGLFVLLRHITLADLVALHAAFQRRLGELLRELLLMPAEEVVDRYGQLTLNRAFNDRRVGIEYGLAATDGRPARFVMLRERACVPGLIAAGVVSAMTVTGRPRTRIRDLDGGIVGHILSLAPARRRQVLASAFDLHPDLDPLLDFGQGNELGCGTLRDVVAAASDPMVLLQQAADRTETFYRDAARHGRPQDGMAKSRAKEEPGPAAFALFAQYLSACGIWLQPVDHVRGARRLLPAKFLPVSAWLSVPERHRGIADLVLSRRASGGSYADAIFASFLAVAGASTTWQVDTLRAEPLVAFKEWAQASSSGSQLMSAGATWLYQECCRHHGVDLGAHELAVHFVPGRRLAKSGVDAFAWCENPNPRNTAFASRSLGRAVTVVPRTVRDWAETLRSLLPLFRRKHIAGLVGALNTWLVFLLSLPEADIPVDFERVDRRRHVNSYADGPTFAAFLRDKVEPFNQQIAYGAPGTLRNAWQLCAVRDGFAERVTNPFSATEDRPGKAAERRAKTSRSALDQQALAVIVAENRKDDFAFARSLGRRIHYRTVLDPETGRHEAVFYPLVPIALDVILHSGARNQQTAWLDSGEGDELAVDLTGPDYVENRLQTAKKGHKQGFIQVHEIIDGNSRRSVLGMFFNTDKVANKAFEVSWCDPDVAASVARLRGMQERYNPMNAPIPALRPAVTNKYIEVTVASVFPLFRDPASPLHQPITASQLHGYWRALLQHCQPVVDARLGYAYPLILDDGPRFDIHALRVTTVTVLMENGVSPEIVQLLVGHKSVMMTIYYNAVRDATIHRRIQEAMERWKATGGSLGEDEADDIIKGVIEEHVTLRAGEDFAGVDLLHDHRDRRTGFDLFTHGICPGGDCAIGGDRLAEGRYGPVWRPRACSGCRFRVTGPQFLPGLVHRLNGLMAEVKLSTHREQRLLDAAFAAEDEGRPAATLRENAARERSDRDRLWTEWCRELRTIKAAEAMLHGPGREAVSGLIRHPDFDPGRLELRTGEVHEIELLHTLVREAQVMPSNEIDLPHGVRETRDRLLLQVIRAQDLTAFYYRLDPGVQVRALDRLGDLLVMYAGDPDRMQALAAGEASWAEIPALSSAIEDLVAAPQVPAIGAV